MVNESEAAAVLGRRVAGTGRGRRRGGRPGRGRRAQRRGHRGRGGRRLLRPAATADAARRWRPPTAAPAAPPPARRPARPADPARTSSTVPGFKVTAVDTVGAGDTFVGALAVALAAGVPPVDAVTAAAAAGAAAAARPGTQSGMPRPADVLAATGHRWPVTVALTRRN